MNRIPSFDALLDRAESVDPRFRAARERVHVTDLLALDVFSIRLRTMFETRSLAFRPRRGEPTLDLPADPDPWSIELAHDEGAGPGSRIEHALGIEYSRVCVACTGIGDHSCARCGGTGTVGGRNSDTRPCPVCDGSGRSACPECLRSGVVVVEPAVISVLDVDDRRFPLIVESEFPIPTEVFVALDASRAATEPLASVVASPIDDSSVASLAETLRAAGVYDTAPFEDAAKRITARLGLGRVRMVAQKLEVSRIPVYAFKASGRPSFAVGDPPIFHPANAFSNRRLGWVAGIVGMALLIATAALIATC